MPLLDLPSESLLVIADHIESESDLSRLSQSSKFLLSLLSGPLYKRLSDTAKESHGRYLLHWAASNGNVQIAKTVLEAGIDIDGRYCEYDGMTPLQTAACNENTLEVVKVLIEQGADIDAIIIPPRDTSSSEWTVTTPCKDSPLMLAVANRHRHPDNIAMIDFFIGKGADPDARWTRCSPLTRAVKDGMEDVVRALLMWGANPNKGPFLKKSPVQIAAKKGNLRIVTMLFYYGAKFNRVSQRGYPTLPLELAAREGHRDVVGFLIDIGAKYDFILKYGGEDSLCNERRGGKMSKEERESLVERVIAAAQGAIARVQASEPCRYYD